MVVEENLRPIYIIFSVLSIAALLSGCVSKPDWFTGEDKLGTAGNKTPQTVSLDKTLVVSYREEGDQIYNFGEPLSASDLPRMTANKLKTGGGNKNLVYANAGMVIIDSPVKAAYLAKKMGLENVLLLKEEISISRGLNGLAIFYPTLIGMFIAPGNSLASFCAAEYTFATNGGRDVLASGKYYSISKTYFHRPPLMSITERGSIEECAENLAIKIAGEINGKYGAVAKK